MNPTDLAEPPDLRADVVLLPMWRADQHWRAYAARAVCVIEGPVVAIGGLQPKRCTSCFMLYGDQISRDTAESVAVAVDGIVVMFGGVWGSINVPGVESFSVEQLKAGEVLTASGTVIVPQYPSCEEYMALIRMCTHFSIGSKKVDLASGFGRYSVMLFPGGDMNDFARAVGVIGGVTARRL